MGLNISGKKLREYVPVYEERTVDRDLLVEGQRNLTDYLQAQGFFDAEVEFKAQRVINDRPKSIILLIRVAPSPGGHPDHRQPLL